MDGSNYDSHVLSIVRANEKLWLLWDGSFVSQHDDVTFANLTETTVYIRLKRRGEDRSPFHPHDNPITLMPGQSIEYHAEVDCGVYTINLWGEGEDEDGDEDDCRDDDHVAFLMRKRVDPIIIFK